jgi:hypothetical protein
MAWGLDGGSFDAAGVVNLARSMLQVLGLDVQYLHGPRIFDLEFAYHHICPCDRGYVNMGR